MSKTGEGAVALDGTTSAEPAVVRKSEDQLFVSRRRVGQASLGAIIITAASILALSAFVALGAAFASTIGDGVQAHAETTSAMPSVPSTSPFPPALASSSQAAEVVDTGMAIFPYGEVDLHDVNAAEWAFNLATLPLELASSQEHRDAWLTGTIETGVGFVQLMAGALNLAAQQKNPIGYAFKGVTGATNLVSRGLVGKTVFDGEKGVEMVRAFLSMADFENNGLAGGMGRMGMMMGGSIWNEAMVMGSRNRLNASYALGAWTIDILPWVAAMRPGSHAAQRMGRNAAAIAKWRKLEVAKDARKLAKAGQPSLFSRVRGRFSRAEVAQASAGTAAATAATAASDVASSADDVAIASGLMLRSDPAWSTWARKAGLELETAQRMPGELAIPEFMLPNGSRLALDGSAIPSTAGSRAEFQRLARAVGVQDGPNRLTPAGGSILLPEGSEHVPGLRRLPAVGQNTFDDVAARAGTSNGRFLKPGDPGFEQALADLR